jgi:ribosome hibernation promoting factor
MQITITGRHVEITKSLRSYAEQKLKRLSRYSFDPMEATLRLAVEKYRHMAEIALWVNGSRIVAKEETDEMYQSIDLAMEKIEQRLRRFKEKLSRHKPSSSSRSPFPKPPKPKPIIVREAQIVIAQSLEDAISRLGSNKSNYVVFVDDSDEKVKLLTREKNDRLEITELVIE